MQLVVVGAGGFGRETLDVVEAINRSSPSPAFEVLGVLDSSPSDANLERLAARGIAFLGGEDAWLKSGNRAGYLIGVGSPGARRKIDAKFSLAGLVAATVVHPTAILGSQVTTSEGVIICSGVQVSTNVRLGRHVHLNPNSTIGHDSVLADFVSVNPAAAVSGDVLVNSGVLVGAASVILQGLTVGENAVVGAGACVTKNTSANSVVKGVPAR